MFHDFFLIKSLLIEPLLRSGPLTIDPGVMVVKTINIQFPSSFFCLGPLLFKLELICGFISWGIKCLEIPAQREVNIWCGTPHQESHSFPNVVMSREHCGPKDQFSTFKVKWETLSGFRIILSYKFHYCKLRNRILISKGLIFWVSGHFNVSFAFFNYAIQLENQVFNKTKYVLQIRYSS